jgi:hypothetical protein
MTPWGLQGAFAVIDAGDSAPVFVDGQRRDGNVLAKHHKGKELLGLFPIGLREFRRVDLGQAYLDMALFRSQDSDAIAIVDSDNAGGGDGLRGSGNDYQDESGGKDRENAAGVC